VALLALADGMIGLVDTLAVGGGADLTLMQAGIADMSFSTLGEEVGAAIAAMPEVEWVSGLLFNVVPYPPRPYFLVLGVDPQGAGIHHYTLVHGRPLAADDEILLGRMAGDFLQKRPGDEMIVQNHTYRVAGIYETGGGYEDAGCLMALTEAQRLFRKPNQVSFYQIKLQSTALDRDRDLIARLQQQFPTVAAYRSSEFARNAPDIQTLQTIARGVSLIGLLAGALATLNTMLMSVLERTREIGTLRAIGWSERQVLGLILGEALALSLMGGLTGSLLGSGLVGLVNLSPALRGAFVGRLDLGVLAGGLALALGLGVVGGLYPAWRAARLQPADALRYG
jgi:putative ABC transport system permease protein